MFLFLSYHSFLRHLITFCFTIDTFRTSILCSLFFTLLTYFLFTIVFYSVPNSILISFSLSSFNSIFLYKTRFFSILPFNADLHLLVSFHPAISVTRLGD